MSCRVSVSWVSIFPLSTIFLFDNVVLFFHFIFIHTRVYSKHTGQTTVVSVLNDQTDPKAFMATYNPRPDDTGEFIVVCSIA